MSTIQTILEKYSPKYGLEIEPLYLDNAKYVDTFIEKHPTIKLDKSFVNFLQKYETIGLNTEKDNFGIYGWGMIEELNEPPIEDNDYLGFSTFIKDFEKEESLSITFFYDLSSEREQGIYRKTCIYTQDEITYESDYHFFCNTFIEFLEIIFDWIDKNVSKEEALGN
ncbi:hypothetical protein AAG747_27500 [Rapidithrix thailandica]|uniref:Knr4/Smi1-like domain-containing protein n=1 Tax=Rapidithrix thailandica TaxID=413964 RepID=A0AAW9SE83_9BACT